MIFDVILTISDAYISISKGLNSKKKTWSYKELDI